MGFDHRIETARLVGRPWKLEDVEDAFTLWGDTEVTRYVGMTPLADLDEARARLGAMIARYEAFGPPFMAHALVERATGEIVGTTLLKPVPISAGHPPGDDVEIGWHLARRHWGRGLATEAGRALVDHAFRHLDRDVLVAVVEPPNARSLAVARRLGMTHRGRTVRYYDLELELFELRRPTTAAR